LPIIAVRYEQIVANARPVFEKLFEFCGTGHVNWRAIEEVLSKDSQAGTIYDRDLRSKRAADMPPELAQDVLELVASRPKLGSAHVILPGTIDV
jgi:hypothetical protein